MPRWGRGGGDERSSQFWSPNFFKGPPFGITLRHPFLADQPQSFSNSAFGAKIINFKGEHAPKKRNIFW